MAFLVTAVLLSLAGLLSYLYWLNSVLESEPPEVFDKYSPQRWTPAIIAAAMKRHEDDRLAQKRGAPEDDNVVRARGPKTGHRYIVVGGSGFLGGWIILHLLARGELPSRIRILDIAPPRRRDFLQGDAAKVPYVKVDITNRAQVLRAFAEPWPDVGDGETGKLVVFHTAAVIRFFEEHVSMVHRSAKVNFLGTQNVIKACQAAGASFLIYTSSGSIAIPPPNFLITPWTASRNPFFCHVNDESPLPTSHSQACSNYTFTKAAADAIVLEADKTSSGGSRLMRTGCIRPGNTILGQGDIVIERYLCRDATPSWMHNILQSSCYVENVAFAHLQYERCLLDLKEAASGTPSRSADIGGQAFCVTDPNPAITFGDIYLALSTLTGGRSSFPRMPPMLALLFAQCFGAYHVFWMRVCESARTRKVWEAEAGFVCEGSEITWLAAPPDEMKREQRADARSTPERSLLARILPPLSGDLLELQPALLRLSSTHVVISDARARLPPAEGGFGYTSPYTTLQGVCKAVSYFERVGARGKGGYRKDEDG